MAICPSCGKTVTVVELIEGGGWRKCSDQFHCQNSRKTSVSPSRMDVPVYSVGSSGSITFTFSSDGPITSNPEEPR